MGHEKRTLLILGTGSEAAWALDILAALHDPFEIRGLVELKENAGSKGQTIDGHTVVGHLDELLTLTTGGGYYIVATRANRMRSDAARRAEVCGILPTKLLHPRATLARTARIEPNVMLHPAAIVGPHAKIRAGTLVNTNVVVDGFASIGPFAHLDMSCRVGLRAVVDTFATVGVGATVLPGVRVGRGAVVAPASVVTEDVPDYAVVTGAPARVIRILERPADEAESSSFHSDDVRAKLGISGRTASTRPLATEPAEPGAGATAGAATNEEAIAKPDALPEAAESESVIDAPPDEPTPAAGNHETTRAVRQAQDSASAPPLDDDVQA